MGKSLFRNVNIPSLTADESEALVKQTEEITKGFVGQFDELESALGMLMIGRLVGWKVLVLIHNKRTIRNYEEILGIDIREAFPPEGPLWEKSAAYKTIKDLGNFWKYVSGEMKVDDRREMVKM